MEAHYGELLKNNSPSCMLEPFLPLKREAGEKKRRRSPIGSYGYQNKEEEGKKIIERSRGSPYKVTTGQGRAV